MEQLCKNSTIVVTVEEALNDVIVVSYSCSNGVFQGVLMNSDKKILPCGVSLPQTVMSPNTNLDEDKLFSVSQRFTYFQDKLLKTGPNNNVPLRLQKSKKSKPNRNNMTVRLRPRQVLCSKCKGICNENSENVDHSKKKEHCPSPNERRLSVPGEKSPRPLFTENQQDNQPRLQDIQPDNSPPKNIVQQLIIKTKPTVTQPLVAKSKHKHSINQPMIIRMETNSSPPVIPLVVDTKLKSTVTKSKVIDDVSSTTEPPLSGSGSGPVENSDIEPVICYWLRPSTTNTDCESPYAPSKKSRRKTIPFKNESPKIESPNVVEEIQESEDSAPDSEPSIPPEELESSSRLDTVESNIIKSPFSSGNNRMVLRKKRSLGAMEDLWDETVLEDNQKSKTVSEDNQKSKSLKTTPVIKISFGSQGEGTVLKIPSKIQTCNTSESDVEEKKAVRKAMKKAKKEARRKLSMSPLLSPLNETIIKKQKKKEKHKKKHKTEVTTTCPKLSINLKRLNVKELNVTPKDDDNDSSSNSSLSDEESPPDFPTNEGSSRTEKVISSCVMNDGNNLSIDDIVWGKVHGFPWWPGKVLSISLGKTDSNEDITEAHVSWFGSSTSSMMPCNQLCPFIDTFKLRFNKRKKSNYYKEAIRQATEAAKKIPSEVLEMID